MDYFTYFAFFVILIRLWLFRLCMYFRLYSLKHFVRKFKIFANEIISTKVYWLFFRRKKEPDRVDIRMFWKRKNMIWTMFRQMITFLMVPITRICGGYRVKLNSLFFLILSQDSNIAYKKCLAYLFYLMKKIAIHRENLFGSFRVCE